MPLLSIVTVCFNAAATVARAAASVVEAKTPAIEYVVVDGASTDGTLAQLAPYRDSIDVLVSEADRGIFDAMGKGVARSSGEFVLFLNADDAMLPGAIAAIVETLTTRGASIDVLYGDWIGVAADGTRHLRVADHQLGWRHRLCHQAIAARRALFATPAFDPRYRICGDFDLLLRWNVAGARFVRLDQPLVEFSETGVSNRRAVRASLESLGIARRRLGLRRAWRFMTLISLYLGRSLLKRPFARDDHAVAPRAAEEKLVVVSAVNLVEGGTLTILRDCLRSAAESLSAEWRIVALVHDRRLVDVPRVECVEMPRAKSSWFVRIDHEWLRFRSLSLAWKPDLWLSLHDVTPRVQARRQIVYCHNPSPFYDMPWREAVREPRIFLFTLFYRFLYGAFVRRNRYVVVQQQWLRVAFRKLYGDLPLVVAHPQVAAHRASVPFRRPERGRFFFPSLPRGYKNFETLCEAARRLEERGVAPFQVRITIAGDENAYARWLHGRYRSVASIVFIGLQDRDGMEREYAAAEVVVFPAKLETWGLPISEAVARGVPVMLADLPYAHETVGTCASVSFFPPTDAAALADLMQQAIEGRWRPTGAVAVVPPAPFTSSWKELWQLMVSGL